MKSMLWHPMEMISTLLPMVSTLLPMVHQPARHDLQTVARYQLDCFQHAEWALFAIEHDIKKNFEKKNPMTATEITNATAQGFNQLSVDTTIYLYMSKRRTFSAKKNDSLLSSGNGRTCEKCPISTKNHKNVGTHFR